ncbi:MAG: NAD/NADP octopine/nopaline dehydrogenase family protein [Bacillota bacterium]|nr:NAD/NADP octopine/nopaline dehydrogenase family protein [Bacillota bacterium]
MSSANNEKLVWAVIGGGNGGQSAAGHLGILGFTVRIYDIIPETVKAIQEAGGIYVNGSVEGFGPVDLATGNIRDAVHGADIVMVIAPSLAHAAIAKELSPHLEDGQLVFIHPGSTLGALEFRKIFDEENIQVDVTVCEAISLVYACRSDKPGHASIKGIKNNVMVAAIPANRTKEAVSKLNSAFPQFIAGNNVLETSLNNLNAVMHPTPTVLNTSMIESKHDWKYYWDGITPSIGRFTQELDQERVNIGKAFGVKLDPVLQMYKTLYNSEGKTLAEAILNTDAYREIAGQKKMETRYLLEDIPMGLVPMISLAKVVGVNTDRMETIAKLGGYLLDRDFFSAGRTLEKLGLDGMNAEGIIEYLTTGVKSPQSR